jgi:F420-non-reducing hydrogenase iron-sulfur subunit
MTFNESRSEFEPEITAFYCVYCGYMAADTAGAMHIQYPPNVKFVRLPCSGKTDIRYLLEAFEQGADGVYLLACPIGNCHHVRGNERGQARMERAKKYWTRSAWAESVWICSLCPAARDWRLRQLPKR